MVVIEERIVLQEADTEMKVERIMEAEIKVEM